MPPPSLSSTTIVSAMPSRRAASRPPRSWSQRDVAGQQHDGPGRAAATPKAVDTVPSIPFAPRLASTRGGASRAGKNVSTSRTGIEEATTSVAVRRADARRARRDARLGVVAAPSVSAMRAGRGAVGNAPAGEPLAVARAARERSAAPHHGRGSARSRVADAARRVLPGGLGVEGDLERRSRPCEPLAQRLGRRQVADAQHELGPRRGGTPRRAAARRSGRRPPAPRRAPDSGSASSGIAARGRRTRPARRPSRGSCSARPATTHRARALVELGPARRSASARARSAPAGA